MAFEFSIASLKKISDLDQDLIGLSHLIMQTQLIDIGVEYSFRGKEEQNKLFAEDKSKKMFPDSKHNKRPALAVDYQIYINGVRSYNRVHYCYLAGIAMAQSQYLGFTLRWGGNWDQDGEIITDQKFQDLMHFEKVIKP